ncbi:MAG TPA: hypothetical protein VIG30_17440 [Ktedonobacterales bacterium]|jgi:hypothetical protein
MTRSDTRHARARAAPPQAVRALGARLWAGVHSRWAVVPLVLVVAAGAFFLGRSLAPASAAQPLPTYVALPPHAQLAWYDHFAQAQVEDWTYTVAGATNASLAAFYQASLPRDGWGCVRTMTMTDIVREGTAYTGTSVYLTALRDGMKAQIYTADQAYGGFLLQDDLPAHAVALKISLENADQAKCV